MTDTKAPEMVEAFEVIEVENAVFTNMHIEYFPVPAMVERVAKAIDDIIRIDSGFDVLNLEEVARAAIEAMRLPTEAMLDAADDAGGVGDDGRAEDAPPRHAWAAMIEAALNPPPPRETMTIEEYFGRREAASLSHTEG